MDEAGTDYWAEFAAVGKTPSNEFEGGTDSLMSLSLARGGLWDMGSMRGVSGGRFADSTLWIGGDLGFPSVTPG